MDEQILRKLKGYNSLLTFVLDHPHLNRACWLGMVWALLEEMMEISTKATSKPKGKHEERSNNRKTRRA